NYSPSLVGMKTVLIDGTIVQTKNQSFDYNGESDLNLEYTMSLTYPQQGHAASDCDLPEG
ncbi:hypothetical protein C0991_009660, partial [Blastosporella zonata]